MVSDQVGLPRPETTHEQQVEGMRETL
jgi:hypothetical protein